MSDNNEKNDDVIAEEKNKTDNNAAVEENKSEESLRNENNVKSESDSRGNKDESKDSKKEWKKEEKKLREENEKLSASLSALTDKYTRMLAEYDNFRKRASKERDGIYGDACADVLKEVLTVKDSLEMAMKYADDGDFSKGISMTLAKFDEVLKKLGVEEFGKAGEDFDPSVHNAVFHTEDDALGENQIAEVMLKGYRKGDKIIRYAMVKVAN